MKFRIISGVWLVCTCILIVINLIGVDAFFYEFFTNSLFLTKPSMLFILVVALFYIPFAFINLTYFYTIYFKRTLHHLSPLRVVSVLNLLVIGIYVTSYVVLILLEGTFHIQIPLMMLSFILQLYIIMNQNSFFTEHCNDFP